MGEDTPRDIEGVSRGVKFRVSGLCAGYRPPVSRPGPAPRGQASSQAATHQRPRSHAAPAGRLSIRRRSSRRRASGGHVGDFDRFDPTSYGHAVSQWLTSGDPEQHCKDRQSSATSALSISARFRSRPATYLSLSASSTKPRRAKQSARAQSSSATRSRLSTQSSRA